MFRGIASAVGCVLLLSLGTVAAAFETTPCAVHAFASMRAPDAPDGVWFGDSVAIGDGLAVIGAPGDSTADQKTGAAYVYRFTGDGWELEAKLTPGDVSSTGFGAGVALVGTLIVVGQTGVHVSDDQSGAAYVYQQQDGIWTQVQQITWPESQPGFYFGAEIAATAEHVAVSGMTGDLGSMGVVCLYRVDGGTLVYEQTLLGVSEWDRFGSALSLDRERLVVGAPDEYSSSTDGLAYVYECDGAEWRQTARLAPPVAVRWMQFGYAVAVQGDVILVAAPEDETVLGGGQDIVFGSVYVFRRSGAEWAEEAKLIASDHSSFAQSVAFADARIVVATWSGLVVLAESAGEWVEQQHVAAPDTGGFGHAIAVYDDRALVGAYTCSDVGKNAGVAFMFRSADGLWAQEQEFLPDRSMAYAGFGSNVAIDGVTAAAGAPREGSAGLDAGAVYVYGFSGFKWGFAGKLTAPDAEPGDQFGTAVAVGPGVVLAGAPEEDENGENAGAVYVYSYDGTAWTYSAKLLAGSEAVAAHFGASLALSGDALIVGAPGFNEARGVAYVFRRGTAGWTPEAILEMAGSQAGDQFGFAVDVRGDRALVGGPSAGGGAGRVLAFVYSNGAWTPDGELGPVSGLAAGADFGWAVSGRGDLALVGAPGASGNGALYQFQRTAPGSWSEVGRLDGRRSSRFGCSVDADESVIIVGAEREGAWASRSGGVHVFIATVAGWSEAGGSSSAYDEGEYGRAVALGGGWAVIGAPGNDEYGVDSGFGYIVAEIADCNQNEQLDACEILSGSGEDINENGLMDECESSVCVLEQMHTLEPDAHTDIAAIAMNGDVVAVGSSVESTRVVYVYRSNGNGWAEEARLTGGDGALDDGFGEAIAIRGDLLLVGAPTETGVMWGDGAGYLYRFDGANWNLEARFSTPGFDNLGMCVALGENVAVLSAPLDSMHGYHDGAVYVFRYDGVNWVAEATIAPPEASDSDYLGAALALDEDVLVIGAPYRDECASEAGAVYIYRYDGSQWQYEARLVAPDCEAIDYFGTSVAIAGDVVVVGSNSLCPGPLGAAYVFRRVDGNWIMEATLTSTDAAPGDRSGRCVATDGRVTLVNVLGRGESDYGYAAVFAYGDEGWVETARLAAHGAGAPNNFGIVMAMDHGQALVGANVFPMGARQMVMAYTYYGLKDCDGNGQLDACELEDDTAVDENGNWVLDRCEVIGDVNCDGSINTFDIDPFVLALVAPDAHQAAFPDCPLANADANRDGAVNTFDIDPFVSLLTGAE